MAENYLSIDLGASSGRMMIVQKESDIFIEEISRFDHHIYEDDGHLFLSFKKLMIDIKDGIDKAIKKYTHIKSIGIDSWAVDYSFIDSKGKLLRDPIFYRDKRGYRASTLLHKIIDKNLLYQKTGIQYLPFNTIYQLYDDVLNYPLYIENAHFMLMIPDLVNYYLCGEAAVESTNFSTTGFVDVHTHLPIETLKRLNIKSNLFPKRVHPGHMLGYLNYTNIAKYNKIKVINVASHDTASAFASIKKEKQTLILNSGTWSLLGTILDKPHISKLSQAYNFTNELGMQGIRFLKNLMGMWMLNQCKKQWDIEEKQSYGMIEKMAGTAQAYQSFIDPDHSMFQKSDQMINSIQKFCQLTNQNIPKTISEIARTIYDSLAFKYKYTITILEKILGYKFNKMIMIGGGTQSMLLNQLTAKVTQKEVYIGPIEATVLGNALVQMLANKDIDTLEEGQMMLYQNHRKLDAIPYTSEDQLAYERFLKIQEKGKKYEYKTTI